MCVREREKRRGFCVRNVWELKDVSGKKNSRKFFAGREKTFRGKSGKFCLGRIKNK